MGSTPPPLASLIRPRDPVSAQQHCVLQRPSPLWRRARKTVDMRRRFFVYVLTNRPRGVLYIGVTNDLERRLAQHKAKAVSGFTREYGVLMLVYYEEYASIVEARAREAAMKRWRRAWKINLVESLNPDWRDLAEDLAL